MSGTRHWKVGEIHHLESLVYKGFAAASARCPHQCQLVAGETANTQGARPDLDFIPPVARETPDCAILFTLADRPKTCTAR